MQQSDIQKLQKALSRPIALVGMMGAGKTFHGGQLAKALDLQFYDADKVIEDKAGMPVADIFERYGEPKFRESEHKTILEMLERGPLVLATGGGALMNPQTLAVLREKSIMIWLDADLETLWHRVQKSQTRPLLKTDDPKERLESLLAQRRPLYEKAHIRVRPDPDNGQKAQDELIKSLCEYLNNDRV